MADEANGNGVINGNGIEDNDMNEENPQDEIAKMKARISAEIPDDIIMASEDTDEIVVMETRSDEVTEQSEEGTNEELEHSNEDSNEIETVGEIIVVKDEADVDEAMSQGTEGTESNRGSFIEHDDTESNRESFIQIPEDEDESSESQQIEVVKETVEEVEEEPAESPVDEAQEEPQEETEFEVDVPDNDETAGPEEAIEVEEPDAESELSKDVEIVSQEEENQEVTEPEPVQTTEEITEEPETETAEESHDQDEDIPEETEVEVVHRDVEIAPIELELVSPYATIEEESESSRPQSFIELESNEVQSEPQESNTDPAQALSPTMSEEERKRHSQYIDFENEVELEQVETVTTSHKFEMRSSREGSLDALDNEDVNEEASEEQDEQAEDKIEDDREGLPSLKNIKSRFENVDGGQQQAPKPAPGKLKYTWSADAARNKEVSPSPPRDPDIVREEKSREHVPIASGGIGSIKQQYMATVSKPAPSAGPPQPIQIPRQTANRTESSPSPARDPNVVRAEDVQDEGQFMPPPQTTRGLVARFKQLETEGQGQVGGPAPEQRLDLLEQERQIPDSGEFTNRPQVRDDVVTEWDEVPEQELPEVGAAKSRINMFRQKEKEVAQKPPPAFGDLYSPGGQMVNGDPNQKFQQFGGQQQYIVQ